MNETIIVTKINLSKNSKKIDMSSTHAVTLFKHSSKIYLFDPNGFVSKKGFYDENEEHYTFTKFYVSRDKKSVLDSKELNKQYGIIVP